MKNNLFLIGPMAAGKTSVGEEIAKLNGWLFYDTDQEIERLCGADINTIFSTETEQGFREHESNILKKLTHHHQIILATGGGCIIDPTNRQLLSTYGTVIYLQVSIPQQLARLHHQLANRPLLNNGQDLKKRLIDLQTQREPCYLEIADIIYDTDQFNNFSQLALQIFNDFFYDNKNFS